jgi:cytochrome c553
MKKALGIAAVALFPVAVIGAASALAAAAVTPPPWAYPIMDPDFQRPPEDGKTYSPPGVTKKFTMTQINDPFAPPNWYDEKMPPVVANGRKPDVRACGQCHMPHGMGHPESSSLAGLPVAYIVEQMKAYKNGTRKSLVPARSASMVTIAKAATDAEVMQAAQYFNQRKPVKWIRVVESNTVPKTYVGAGNMRHPYEKGTPKAGTEPIGMRVIELPEDSKRAELRDQKSPFVAYVPVGAIKKGEQLSMTGGNGKTIPCGVCHGPDLKGLGDVPGIAGRSPIYLVRQLMDIKHGSRTGPGVELMKQVVAKLSEEDMVYLAAYTASKNP